MNRLTTDTRAHVRALASAAGSVVIVGFAAYFALFLLREADPPIDFHFYLAAAREIRNGESPYPESSYAPLAVLAAVPFTLLTTAAADLLVKLLLLLGVGATLYVAGVRDWRCYPLALLWQPVYAAVQTGNVTIPFALAAALVWRLRDRAPAAGVTLGASVAAKLILWPLGVWLFATARRAAAVWGAAAAVLIFVGSFVAIGPSELLEYPSALRHYQETALEGYSVDVLAGDLGAGPTSARLLMLGVAGILLAAVMAVGRRGNEMRSFVLAIGATLAFAPYVWLHYFALLLVPVALVRPRLAPIWFVPLGMWAFGAGTGNGRTAEAAVVLGLAAATILLAFRAAPAGEVDRHRDRPARPTVRPASAPR